MTGRIGRSLLVAASSIWLAGCTLIFEHSEDTDNQAPLPRCLGQVSNFDRGPELARPFRFQHIDYNQGTITFWLRPLELPTEETKVLDLSGIAFYAGVGSGLRIELGDRGDLNVDTPDWDVEKDVFVSLRWDRQHPLSGSSTRNSHIEVRVGKTKTLFADSEEFAAKVGSAATLTAGEPSGSFHVDQLVIYQRPLFVSDLASIESELFRMAEDKGPSAIYAAGGFDVMLSTMSPTKGACENFKPLAWRVGTDRGEDDFRVGEPGSWNASSGAVTAVQSDNQVFAGGGATIPANSELTNTYIVAQRTSYLIEVLTHGSGTQLKVFSPGAQGPFAFITSGTADRDNPTRLLLSFTAGDSDQEVDIELSSAAPDAEVYVHSFSLHENLLSDGDFENSDWSMGGVENELWRIEPEELIGNVEWNEMDPYATQHSVCIDSESSPAVILQEPSSLVDDEVYLFGAAFLWNSGVAPGATIGNGSFFRPGTPYRERSKASVLIESIPEWQIASTAGRRSIHTDLNNHNDLIRFGTPGYSDTDASHHCIDSAFTIALEFFDGVSN